MHWRGATLREGGTTSEQMKRLGPQQILIDVRPVHRVVEDVEVVAARLGLWVSVLSVAACG